ncbi:MAG TPA: glutamate--tRNA ligase [Thermoanaerobaculia bacterium]|nr:glutamate--tRNA ligase [Thermoanaerobaculia bacterium]
MSVRVRFAPSPTGHLHVGGARTAIFNWLFARHHHGTFVIRVEDTDQARSTRESEAMVLDDLRWLGLDWEEGPDIGGPHAPYRQSERFERYRTVAGELLERGRAYRCFCTEEDLDRKRSEAEAQSRPPHYDLTCFHLSAEEARARAGKEPFVVRFHVPREGEGSFSGDVTIDDLIRGEITWRGESLGDFIILRSDGMPTYNFSVVADDHDMEITHVIRAEEHLTNTHRQVLLYRALDWPIPAFAHVSLILGQDRSKLSKRHGATSVAAYADEGFLPEAMVNYLTLLGWSAPDGREIFSIDDAVASFSLSRVNPAPAVFDPQKLAWMNGQYIHSASASSLRVRLAGRFRAAGWIRGETASLDAWLDDAIDLVKKGAQTLDELTDALRFFFDHDVSRLIGDEENRQVLESPSSGEIIEKLREDLELHGEPESSEAYQEMVERLKTATGQKGKNLFMPIRIVLMGAAHGPELHRAVPLMTRGSRISELAPVVSPLERARRCLEQALR